MILYGQETATQRMSCPYHNQPGNRSTDASLSAADAPVLSGQRLFREAADFIRQYHRETDTTGVEQRLRDVRASIEADGTYSHTIQELEYGAKVAWRNSNKCIGRLFWKSLKINDERQSHEPDAIAQACFDHLEHAFNGGAIQSTVTVFPAQKPGQEGITIHNHQLLQYAGFLQGKGSVIGDPNNLAITRQALALGWEPDEVAPFQILPLIIQMPNEKPRLYSLPSSAIREIPLSHPQHAWLSDLDLKWYAVPALADMRLEIGGLHYTAAPFNGWYMGTEIGARNLADAHRYDMLPTIARAAGYDTSGYGSLWKDQALVILNQAVLHSFDAAGVKIVDHHTASEQFMHHCRIEEEKGRTVTGDWSWLVPPLSSSTSPIFFEEMDDTLKKPNFFYRD